MHTSDLQADLQAAASAVLELTAFHSLAADPVIKGMAQLAGLLAAGPVSAAYVRDRYRKLAVALVEWAEMTPEAAAGDAWQRYLVRRILEGEHLFGRRAAAAPFREIGESLKQMARQDLARLREMYGLSGKSLKVLLEAATTGSTGDWVPSWDNSVPLDVPAIPDPLERAFHREVDWAALLEPLARHHYLNGTGALGRYPAFRWDSSEGLVGILRPDPITLADLVGYDFQKEALIRNTEQFLSGYPCNNILLYGARGTGKSSLVKALLNAYALQGLRLVEVAREEMRHFPAIVRQLRNRPQRFLLFADDLSYDDSDLHYRELKAALEGSIEGRPENVLLYATSNRRHLIKERFRDRDIADDEIHAHDSAQEKLSLADRFGLTLSFAPPSQAEYLRMVEVIADRRGLAIDRESLRAGAIRWAALHNLPSGRTARQYVDDLEGSLRRGQTPGVER